MTMPGLRQRPAGFGPLLALHVALCPPGFRTQVHHEPASGFRLPVSGSTSCRQVLAMTAAFVTSTAVTISCCTHYLINLIPVPVQRDWSP